MWRRFTQGEFSDLDSWERLWGLLARITVRKVFNANKHGTRARRTPDAEEAGACDWQAIDREPTPEEGVDLEDTVKAVISGFDERGRRIVDLLLQGNDHSEIAQKCDCTRELVSLTLKTFRKRLEKLLDREKR